MQTLAAPQTAPSEDEADYDQWEAIVLHRIETGEFRLPVMPSAATRALELANDPNLDTHDLAILLEHDPAIAANIVRVAAAAAYGASGDIHDLDEAVARIGTSTFCQLVSAFAIQGEVYGNGTGNRLLQRYRKHSLATARIASHLATQVHCDGGPAFLCGLLYTIGKPVVWHLIDDLQRLLQRTVAETTHKALVEGFHVEMARAICQEWDMPPFIRIICGRLEADEEERENLLPAIHLTSLADLLAGHLCDARGKSLDEIAHVPSACFLQLEAADLQEIVHDLAATSDL